MSLSNNFPTLRPTLLLDFVNSGRMDPRITFTRASSATYFNSSGVLETAGNDVARLDFDPATLAPRGLLIEEARTNSLLQSQTFDTTWTASAGTTITADSINAPTGTQVADTITAATANSDNISQNLTLAASTTYTLSFFIKNNTATRSFFRLIGFNSGSTNSQVTINWTGATLVSATGGGTTIVATQTLLNDWYRVAITFTTNASDGGGVSTVQLYPELIQSSRSIYLFGAQLEAGAFPTSYIPTTTTALTRSADVASVNTLSPWYNAAAGTLYAEATSTGYVLDINFPLVASIDDGSNTNRITIQQSASSTSLTLNVRTANVSTTIGDSGFDLSSTPRRIAGAYSGTSVTISVNGSAVITGTSNGVPSGLTNMKLGSSVAGYLNGLNGHLRRVTYYPRALSAAELQAITA